MTHVPLKWDDVVQQHRSNAGPDWLPGWSLGQARGVQGSPDWMPGWGLQPGWRHAIRARGPGSGDTKISAVSPEPGCRDACRVCGWTSIVVGVHVFFTHQGNQSSSQCSLALLTHASKHNAVACSQPGHGGPGSLMRARPVGEDNQSGPLWPSGLVDARGRESLRASESDSEFQMRTGGR